MQPWSPDEFTENPPTSVAEDSGQRVDIIAAHLRADRTLDRATARALERMVRLAYQAAGANGLPPADSE